MSIRERPPPPSGAADTDRLVAAERQLPETERDRVDLEIAERAAKKWIADALREFARSWKTLRVVVSAEGCVELRAAWKQVRQ